MIEKKIYVFDTSAFIKGMEVGVLQDYSCYTTNGVLSEIKNQFSKQKISTALLTGNLMIQTPDPQAIQEVKKIARKSGDLPFLSTIDIGVIAVAITMRTTVAKQEGIDPNDVHIEVVSDDYSVQNVLSQLPIPVHSYMQKGIKNFIQWQIYCPVCKKVYPSSEKTTCPSCEVRLKRRPVDDK